ncbi:MAG: cytochrome c3 family protein, partial [Deltaproteobacteria bacterium]
MRRGKSRFSEPFRIKVERISPCFLLLLSLVVGIFVARGAALASGVDILTPRSGSTVFARNPETHLVLRLAGQGEGLHLRLDKTGKLLDPIISMAGEEATFLHFRLPLAPGKNSFTILPGGQRLVFNFHPIQAQLYQKSFGRDTFFFHQNDELPKPCRECHELKETEIIEPVGLKKQISCATCHKTIVDKGKWKHGPTVNQQCLVCHQQSVKPWRIGFPKGSIDDICLTCHVNKKRWLTSKYRHGPMIGGCTLCHDPHGSNYRDQLWADGSL